MFDTPSITVVTAVRNGADTIQSTLESVLSQDYPSLDYVVVDGASTDATPGIIRRYEHLINRWVSERDLGISDAFNKGASMAIGESVIYMNCGDTFLNKQSLSSLVGATPPDTVLRKSIVYGDAIIVGSLGPSFQCTDHNRLSAGLANTLCHQGTLIGIDIQRRFAYDTRLRFKMDYDLWLRCIDAGVPFVKVANPVCAYLAGGISGQPNNRVSATVEAVVARLINSNNEITAQFLLKLALAIGSSATKEMLRSAAGNKCYSVIKTVAGVPSSLFAKGRFQDQPNTSTQGERSPGRMTASHRPGTE